MSFQSHGIDRNFTASRGDSSPKDGFDSSRKRYCLDGPVILFDDVTLYCEDCEPKAIVPCSLDEHTLLSSLTTDSVNLANNAIPAKRKLKNCIKRLKKSKRLQQKKIGEKQKKAKNSGSVAKIELLNSCYLTVASHLMYQCQSLSL